MSVNVAAVADAGPGGSSGGSSSGSIKSNSNSGSSNRSGNGLISVDDGEQAAADACIIVVVVDVMS